METTTIPCGHASVPRISSRFCGRNQVPGPQGSRPPTRRQSHHRHQVVQEDQAVVGALTPVQLAQVVAALRAEPAVVTQQATTTSAKSSAIMHTGRETNANITGMRWGEIQGLLDGSAAPLKLLDAGYGCIKQHIDHTELKHICLENNLSKHNTQ